MQLEAKKFLYDIQRATDLLAQFTAGRTFADYERDAMLRYAVERGLAIIGEALSQLAKSQCCASGARQPIPQHHCVSQRPGSCLRGRR